MDIGAVLRGLSRTRAAWAPTALAVVAESSRDPFRVLAACLLSLRTRDATTAAASDRLFQRADTPRPLLALPARTLARLIYPVSFYRTKARTLRTLCRVLLDRHAGRVPATLEELLALPGVGRKTANLVLTVAFAKPGICVDTHVHRVSNRLGYVRTRTPDDTEIALRRRLPRRHWIGINDLLVGFGQNVCTPLSPRCSICPVARHCRRVGVGRTR